MYVIFVYQVVSSRSKSKEQRRHTNITKYIYFYSPRLVSSKGTHNREWFAFD